MPDFSIKTFVIETFLVYFIWVVFFKGYMRLKLFFFICFFIENIHCEQLKVDVQAESAIVMNAQNGEILYEKNGKKMMYPASITKIATTLFTLKLAGHRLDEQVIVVQEAVASLSEETKIRSNYTLSPHILSIDGTHMGLKKEEKLTLEDLLYGIMLVSGNDAANMVAYQLGKGNIPLFMDHLNSYLKKIGCKNTHFVNPHGLFHPKHQTTAYDMAVMTCEALQNPQFRKIVSTIQYTRPKTNKNESWILFQSNKLLRKGPFFYPKAIGVKTGYLAKAGHTIVAAAESEGRTLVAVLLKSQKRKDAFLDAIKLFEAAFKEEKRQKVLLKKGVQSFEYALDGAELPIKAMIEKDVIIHYFPSEEPKVKALVYWENVTLPVKKGQRIGYLKVKTKKGMELMEVPLLAQDEVKETWGHWLKSYF